MRDRTLSLPLSTEEWERAETVAKYYGMPVEALLRFLVRREADWLSSPSGFAHAMKQGERRDIIERERERLGTDADL
jgi:hypothetical protein